MLVAPHILTMPRRGVCGAGGGGGGAGAGGDCGDIDGSGGGGSGGGGCDRMILFRLRVIC